MMDFSYAVRQLLRTPGFTAAAIITLALGIGVNTAFFAVVNAVVFRPARSVQLDGVYRPSIGRYGSSGLPAPHFRLLQAHLPDVVEAVDAQATDFRDVIAHIPGRAERVKMLAVSGGHASVFGLRAQAGRFISDDEDRGGVRAVVISDRLWREWFGGDRTIVERATMRINGDVFQIVGVAPTGYRGEYGFGFVSTDLWVPLSYLTGPPLRAFRLPLSLRLKPGVTPEQAAPMVQAVVREADKDVHPNWRIGAASFTLREAQPGNPFRKTGVALLLLSALVLMAACANLANLLYVRGAHRRAEMAVRQALGASTIRIFRLLLCEAAVIGVVATGIGLTLALVATRLFNATFPAFLDRAARVTIDLSPDYTVFAFAAAAGAGAALLVGIASAWRASRVPPLRGMAVGDAATSVTRTSRRTRLGLVALQVGAAVILLMSAGLVYQQTRGAFQDAPSFDTSVLATARIDLARHNYTMPDAHAFFRRLLDGARALPGVDAASLSDGMPRGLYMGGAGVTFVAERTDRPFSRYVQAHHRKVNGTMLAASPGYLGTLNLRVREGRDIVDSDRDGAELVVLVSRSLASGLWPAGDALGKRLMFGNEGHWRTIAGVFDDPVAPRANIGPKEWVSFNMAIAPYEQRYPQPTWLQLTEEQKKMRANVPTPRETPRETLIVIRSTNARGQLDAIRKQVAALDSNVAMFDAATVDESILASIAPMRAGRLLMGGLGAVALAIAVLGIYAVVSFMVARRTREFGIRMALGAARRQVLKMVFDDAFHLLLVGLFVGVFVSAVAERVIDTRQFGMLPNDLTTWTVVLIGILAVGLAAAFVPARRAAGIDPNVALRDL